MFDKQKRLYFIILLILVIVFFVIYSLFTIFVTIPESRNFSGHKIFSWPDAMANNFFIENFIQNNNFNSQVPLNVPLHDIIHPRSTNIYDNDIVPMGFLGILIIYGWLAKIIFNNLIIYNFFTPLFAVLGVLSFTGVVRIIFESKKVATITAILLFTLAPFAYYSSLEMLPNVLFLSLLFIGLYLILKKYYNKYSIYYILLGSFFVGLSFITRPVEFSWVSIIFLVLAIAYGRESNIP